MVVEIIFPDKTHKELPLNSVGSPLFVPRIGETIDTNGADWKVISVVWDIDLVEPVCTIIVE